MKKKILGLALACTLVVSQAVVAFAAPSRTATTVGVGNTTVSVVTNYSSEIKDSEALSILELAISTNATDAEIVNAVNATGDVKLGTTSFVTKFLDVSAPKSDDGYHHVSLQASLPSNATTANVRGLHYSVARGVWEVVVPTSVENGVVSFALTDCSPLAVYVTDGATSPVTGAVSMTALFVGAAAASATVAVTAKKRK